MTNFGDLYQFNDENGTIIPEISQVQSTVETTLKEIFGSDFSVEPETIGGRLVEAMTLFFKTVCAVNAQNAGMVNPQVAVGAYLDHIGALFGVYRNTDETDIAFRSRIYECTAVGQGFASSIRRALGNLDGISNVVVLDNGYEYPKVMPVDEKGRSLPHSITVDPHSVFISFRKDPDSGTASDEAIGRAVMRTKSAGCGYTANPEYGTITTYRVTESGETIFEAKAYTSTPLAYRITLDVRNDNYIGTDIASTVIDAVTRLVDSHPTNYTIKESDVISAVAAGNSGIVVETVEFEEIIDRGGADETTQGRESIVVKPYRYLEVSSADIIVNVV